MEGQEDPGAFPKKRKQYNKIGHIQTHTAISVQRIHDESTSGNSIRTRILFLTVFGYLSMGKDWEWPPTAFFFDNQVFAFVGCLGCSCELWKWFSATLFLIPGFGSIYCSEWSIFNYIHPVIWILWSILELLNTIIANSCKVLLFSWRLYLRKCVCVPRPVTSIQLSISTPWIVWGDTF